MKPDLRLTAAAHPAAGGHPAVAADATTTAAMPASLVSRAGSCRRIEGCNTGRCTRSYLAQKFPMEVFMSGRGRSSFTKRQKERSRQEKQREKAERKAQRKLEKPEGAEGSDELSAEAFSAVAEQWALPGGASDEYDNENE